MVTRKKRRIGLGTLVLAFLFLFTLIPLVGFSSFTLTGILAQLGEIEEHEELHLMLDELHHLETKIDTYKQVVGFVSELPAVMELLHRGGSVPGSISREKAASRYAGVLTRVFAENQDIESVHLLDLNGVERFALAKGTGEAEYRQLEAGRGGFAPESIRKVLAMPEKDFFLTLLLDPESDAPGEAAHRFQLRIFTPVFENREKIGIYVGDISVDVLGQEFPDFVWVLNDGCYLADAHGQPAAFNDFPGLARVFAAGRAGVHDFPTGKMAWAPFFAGENVDLSLWAGKKVDLASVRVAREKIRLHVLLGLSALLAGGLAVSLFFSKYVQHLSAQVLRRLEGFIFHRQGDAWGEESRIKEFAEFSRKMISFLAQYAALEESRQDSQARLAQSEELFRIVFNAVQSAVILIDGQDEIRFFNPAAERIFGYRAEEIMGLKLHQLVVAEGMQEEAQKGLAKFWRSGEGPIVNRSRELIARKKDGRIFPAEVFVARIKRDNAYWAVGAVIDITDRKAKEEKLVMLATIDGLTGVFNRRHFMALADQEFIRSRRYGKSLFFLMLDLDHFKEINDTFGHETGDQVLRQFASLCREILRAADIFARLGGEEFAAILVETDEQGALAVAERIRGSFARKDMELNGKSRSLSVSIGVSRIDADCASLDAAYREADNALYEAKRRGRNRVMAAWE
ncbi:diguanylate cyclase [Thiovibrio sp. JS02]